MFKLDNEFLTNLGLGSLPVDEKNKLLQVIYERLELNVGMRLAEKMTDAQLDEFEGFIDRNDEAGALRWLETNFPNYKDVVAEELEKLKQEVQANAPQILAAAQNSPVQAQMPGQPMPTPQAQPQFAPAPPADSQAFAPQPMSQPQPAFQPQPMPQATPSMPTPDPYAPQPSPAPQAFPQQPVQPPQPMPQQPWAPSEQPPAGQPPAGPQGY